MWKLFYFIIHKLTGKAPVWVVEDYSEVSEEEIEAQHKLLREHFDMDNMTIIDSFRSKRPESESKKS